MTTEQVWNEFADELRGFLYKRVQADAVADDLLQEAFIRIHQNVDKLRESDKVRAWAYRIVRNLVTDHFRKRDFSTELDGDFPDDAEEETMEELMKCLDPMLATLPEKYREPLHLADIKQKKQQEVADELGLSLTAVKSRIQRARKMLKDQFVACCHYQLDEKGLLVGDHCCPDHCDICEDHAEANSCT